MRDLYELAMLWGYIKLAMYGIDLFIKASIFYDILFDIIVATHIIFKKIISRIRKRFNSTGNRYE